MQENKLRPDAKLYPKSLEIVISLFFFLLIIRYYWLFAVHVDLNSKIMIEQPFYIGFSKFRLLLVTIAEDMEESTSNQK